MMQVNLALEKLKNGAVAASDKTQYGLLAECLITANVRIEEILLNDVSQIDVANEARMLINAGLKALIRAYDRKERLGRWGFDGPGLAEISDAVSVYEEIMRNSSPRQMDRARDTAIKRNREAYQREKASA